jgi:hypothetical protein
MRDRLTIVYFTTFAHTNPQLGLSQLEAEVGAIASRVFPRAEALKGKLLSGLYSIQQGNVVLARSLYLLIYSRYFDDPSRRVLAPADMLGDVLLKPAGFVDAPAPMLAQILAMFVKQICQDPTVLITALASAKVPQPYFAFAVFPALFGFFTSVEFCDAAGTFLIQSIQSEISPDLLFYLCLSFFFSAFAFCDTFWSAVCRELSIRPTFKRDEAGSALIHAICCALPLLSSPVHTLITALDRWRPQMLLTLVSRLLRISFEVWCNCTGEGATFRHGEAVQNYLAGLSDGSSADLTSAMVGSLGESPVLPSYTGFCSMASETMIFSACDCQVLVAALRPIAAAMPMFEVLERFADEIGADRFAPFAIKFFGRIDHGCCIYPPLFPVLDIDRFRCDADPIFEAALHQNADLKTPEFRRYALWKAAVHAQELTADFELAITLQQQQRIARDLHRSLERLKRGFFEKWTAANALDILANPVGAAVAFLSHAADREGLLVRTALQFANKLSEPKIPADLLDACLAFSRNRCHLIWKRAGAIGQSRFVQRLVPLVAQRPSISWSQLFSLFSLLFTEIRTIANYQYNQETVIDGITVLLETVFGAANSARTFKAFLVFEKTLLRNGDFVRVLDRGTLSDWAQFFRMMLTTLAENQALLQSCIELDLSASSFV